MPICPPPAKFATAKLPKCKLSVLVVVAFDVEANIFCENKLPMFPIVPLNVTALLVVALVVEAFNTKVFTEEVAFNVPVFIAKEVRLSICALNALNKFVNRFVVVAFVIDALPENRFVEVELRIFEEDAEIAPKVEVEFGVDDAKFIPLPPQESTPFTFEIFVPPM